MRDLLETGVGVIGHRKVRRQMYEVPAVDFSPYGPKLAQVVCI
jgi:hypothetical protein